MGDETLLEAPLLNPPVPPPIAVPDPGPDPNTVAELPAVKGLEDSERGLLWW